MSNTGRAASRARWLMIAAGVTVLILAVTVVVRPDTGSQDDPPGAPWLDWPVLRDEPGNVQEAAAVAAWDRFAGGTHSEVRPLLLREDEGVGVAVLQGRDRDGVPRLTILTADLEASDLVVRADRPLPDRSTTRQISLVTDRLGPRPGSLPSRRGRVLGLVLAGPDAARVSLAAPPAAKATADARFLVTWLPEVAASFTTTVGVADSAGSSDSWADEDTIGSRRSFPAVVVKRAEDGWPATLRVTGTHPRTGQLVLSRTGVVGRISAVDGEFAQVESVGTRGFEAVVTSGRVPRAVIRRGPGGLAVDAMVGGITPPAGELLYAYDDGPDGTSVFPFARLGPAGAGPDGRWPVDLTAAATDDLYVVAAPA